MNRGGGSPSAAANYMLCTNCRKVLRKVRARPGVWLERGASCRPGLRLLGPGEQPSGEAPRDPGAPSPRRDRKRGRERRVEGLDCCCRLSHQDRRWSRGVGDFFGGAGGGSWGGGGAVFRFSAHLTLKPRACSSRGGSEGPVRSSSRCC